MVYHRSYAPLVSAACDPAGVVLVDVDDSSGVEPLPGSVPYEDAVGTPVTATLPEPSPDDLYMVCTGGTTGRPKAVLLDAARVPAAPLHSPQDVLDDAHVAEMGYLRRVPFPGAARPVPIVETPFRMSATPGTIRRRAPLLGEHTDEILDELGYATGQIADLRAHGIV